jgi:hypothetical protein
MLVRVVWEPTRTWAAAGLPDRHAASEHGGGQRGLRKALGQQPALVGQRPGVPAPPDPGRGAAGTCAADAARGCGRRPGRRGRGTGRARPPRLGWECGRPPAPRARCNLASRRQSRRSVLTRSPGALGISEGRSPRSARAGAPVDDPRTCYLRNGAGRSMLTTWSGLQVRGRSWVLSALPGLQRSDPRRAGSTAPRMTAA